MKPNGGNGLKVEDEAAIGVGAAILLAAEERGKELPRGAVGLAMTVERLLSTGSCWVRRHGRGRYCRTRWRMSSTRRSSRWSLTPARACTPSTPCLLLKHCIIVVT